MLDVLIIGAGPSGGIAAKEIADAGFKTKLIDKKKEIGNPIQCGEAITEFCLKDLDLKQEKKWIINKTKGVRIVLPNNSFFYSAQPRLNIDRKIFDQFLVNKAVKNGAELETDILMKNIRYENKKWVVKTNKNDINTKIVIAADGPISKTARILDLLKHKEYGKAVQYKFNKEDVNYDDEQWLSMHMDASLNGGYKWVFPRLDEYNIGVGGLDFKIKYLNNFCKSLGINLKKKKEVNGGLIPINFKFDKRVKNRCLIVGDAAGLTNPSTGGGIHAALYSGKIAAEQVIKSLKSDDYSFLDDYDKIINKSPFLNPVFLKSAKFFSKWTLEDWLFFADVADGLEMDDLTIFKCCKIALKYPSYILRANEMLTIRKAMKINKKYS